MRQQRILQEQSIARLISEFGKATNLGGISDDQTLECFVKQIADSERRVRYHSILGSRNFDRSFANPRNTSFDPIKAATYYFRQGNLEECLWLVFLSVHFGKNAKTGWSLLTSFYSGLGNITWTWEMIIRDFSQFRKWLFDNRQLLQNSGNFGSHRKYESLNAYENSGTGHVVESLVDYILSYGGCQNWINAMSAKCQNRNDRFELFDVFYKDLRIARFGRTGNFDFLCTLGKLKVLPIEPGKIYLTGATGPLRGASLLFDNTTTPKRSRVELEKLAGALNAQLGLYFGSQILEDALCNWQKSPSKYRFYA